MHDEGFIRKVSFLEAGKLLTIDNELSFLDKDRRIFQTKYIFYKDVHLKEKYDP